MEASNGFRLATTHASMHRLRNWAGQLTPRLSAPLPFPPVRRPRVLVVGIYLAGKPNSAAHLVRAYAAAESCKVEQCWIGLGGRHADPEVARVTRHCIERPTPKFRVLNQTLGQLDLSSYDYVVVSDDDVRVRQRFLDSFIGCQDHFGFALAQPARTWSSYYDHRLVLRDPRWLARQTWFVEIGPVFALDRRAVQLLLPFDERSPMGYGFDFVWPAVLRAAGLTLGIVDCCPIDHTLRERSQYYSSAAELATMQEYLREQKHLSYAEALQTVQCYGKHEPLALLPSALNRGRSYRPPSTL